MAGFVGRAMGQVGGIGRFSVGGGWGVDLTVAGWGRVYRELVCRKAAAGSVMMMETCELK